MWQASTVRDVEVSTGCWARRGLGSAVYLGRGYVVQDGRVVRVGVCDQPFELPALRLSPLLAHPAAGRTSGSAKELSL